MRSSILTTSAAYVGDLKIIGMLMELQRGLLNTVVFYVCGTVVPLNRTMKQKNGRQEIHRYLE